ncbi:MAG: hypothetical protein JWR55_1392 [Aeromicrobium sp.]|jgi:RNA polymerase sigma-B factor|nr:hypothetical protein [Aeromicrobium sp.]
MAVDPTSSFPSEECAELFSALASATSARERSALEEQIVEAHLPLASRLAARYRHRGVDVADLTQVASLALVKAVRRYDPDRGTFAAFAATTILGEIKRHFRDYAWTVRPPRPIQDLQATIAAATEQFRHSRGTEPTSRDLADLLGDDLTRIDEARAARACFRAMSLDAPAGQDGSTVQDVVADPRSDHEAIEQLAALAPSCRRLSDAERRLLELRFFRDMTQAEMGQVLGLTQMQVSRHLSRLTRKLRADVLGTRAT